MKDEDELYDIGINVDDALKLIEKGLIAGARKRISTMKNLVQVDCKALGEKAEAYDQLKAKNDVLQNKFDKLQKELNEMLDDLPIYAVAICYDELANADVELTERINMIEQPNVLYYKDCTNTYNSDEWVANWREASWVNLKKAVIMSNRHANAYVIDTHFKKI